MLVITSFGIYPIEYDSHQQHYWIDRRPPHQDHYTGRDAIDKDRLRAILLINALSDDFTHIQSFIRLSLDSTVVR